MSDREKADNQITGEQTADEQTLAVYNDKVSAYAELTAQEEPDQAFMRFMALLPSGGQVLDLGCGPGDASAMLAAHGFLPDPVDASSAMIEFAISTHGLKARVSTFEEIVNWGPYHGVWANFSLLHARRERVQSHLMAISNALLPDGIFHIGMKLGSGEKRDDLGRHYCFFEEDELCTMLTKAGFEVISKEVGEGIGFAGTVDPWIVVLSRRKAG